MLGKKDIHSYLIYTSYIILNIYFFFCLTNFSNLLNSKYLLLLGLGLAFFALLYIKSFDFYRLICLVIVGVVILLNIIYNKEVSSGNYSCDYTFIYLVFFVLTMADIKISDLIRISFFTQLSSLVFTIICFKLNLIENTILYRDGIIRKSFGFAHPNLFGLIVMCITISFLYIYFKKINLIVFILVSGINLYVYTVTLSRTSFLCAIFAILISLLAKYTSLYRKGIIKYILIFSIPVIFLISVILPLFYNTSNFYYLLDEIFSGRLIQGHYYIDKYGISIFGKFIPDTYNILNLYNWTEGWVLDSAYLRILIQQGIIIFIVVFIYVLYKCIILCKNQKVFEVLLIFTSLIYAFFERYSLNIFIFSITLLLFMSETDFSSEEELQIEQN